MYLTLLFEPPPYTQQNLMQALKCKKFCGSSFGLTTKESEMRPTELPYSLRITIEGSEGHGKTLAAYAVQKTLQKLGAWVAIKDRDEAVHPDTRWADHDAPRSAEQPLSETAIVIRTQYPE
jgi:hypothetical protein